MDIWKQQSICFVKAKRSTLFKCHLPAATCNICFGTISIISKKKYLQGQKTIDTNYHRYSNLKSCETILNHAFFGDKLSDMNCKNSAKLKLAPLLILEKTICLRKYRKKIVQVFLQSMLHKCSAVSTSLVLQLLLFPAIPSLAAIDGISKSVQIYLTLAQHEYLLVSSVTLDPTNIN